MATSKNTMSTPPRQDLADGLAATDLLVAMARGDRFAHSLLLVGPPGVGKQAVAMRFAAALFCTAESADRPCGACRACGLLARGSHPDVLVAPAPLRVEAVRGVCTQFALSPSEAPLRFALVAEVDLASPAAANALLKTIEEPPSYGVIVLTASSSAKVLPTLRSRCRIVQVARRSTASVAAALEANGVAVDRAAVLAGLADGRLGWALSTAETGDFEQSRGRWLDDLTAALAEGPVDRLERASRMMDSGDVVEAIGAWRTWARDVMALSVGYDSSLVGADRAPQMRAHSSRLGPRGAVALLSAIETALARMAANANRQLALEALLLELPQ